MADIIPLKAKYTSGNVTGLGEYVSTDTIPVIHGGTGSTIATGSGSVVLSASPTFTGTVSGITKAMVGLGSADNTSDASKPVSTATQTALDTKVGAVSPAFTGVPTAPTAAVGTNTTQIATTAFVTAEALTKAVAMAIALG